MRGHFYINILITICSVISVICFSGCSSECDSDYDWHKIWDAPVPPSSSYRSCVYDEARNRLVIFNGTSAMDMWEYDGEVWTERILDSASRPQLYDSSACYHRGEGVIYCFGGRTSEYSKNFSNILWMLKDNMWTEITPDISPPERSNAHLVYYPDRDSLVLFGGYCGIYLGDTWEYSEGQWLEIETDQSPGPRMEQAMAYEPLHQRIILFGGRNEYDRFNDTWSYDGQTWSRLETPNSPSMRYSSALATDWEQGTVVLFGGYYQYSGYALKSYWRFDGQDWQEICSFNEYGRYDYPYLYQVSGESIFRLFCSYASQYYGPPYVHVYRISDTDIYQEKTVFNPNPRYWMNDLEYDPRTERFILFCRYDYHNRRSTWMYQEGVWQRLSNYSQEMKGDTWGSFSMYYDHGRECVILVPEQDYFPPSPFILYELHGAVWTERQFEHKPTAEKDFSIAYDSDRKVLVLFGGYLFKYYPYNYFNETWEYDGSGFRQVFPKRAPSPRGKAAMVYDSDRRKIVLFGGNDGYGNRRDTWEYDGRTWEKIETLHAPEWASSMVYHKGLGAVIMCTRDGDDYTEDMGVWAYDEHDWERVLTSRLPHNRFLPSVAYDENKDTLLLFGGVLDLSAEPVLYADTWELHQ